MLLICSRPEVGQRLLKLTLASVDPIAAVWFWALVDFQPNVTDAAVCCGRTDTYGRACRVSQTSGGFVSQPLQT